MKRTWRSGYPTTFAAWGALLGAADEIALVAGRVGFAGEPTTFLALGYRSKDGSTVTFSTLLRWEVGT